MMARGEETIERLKKQAEEEELDPDLLEPKDVFGLDDEVLGEDDQEPKQKNSAPREYVVLLKGSGNNWGEVARTEARSAGDAIRSLGQRLQSGSQYTAVPARNWHPVTIEVEQPPPILRFKS